MRKVLIAIFIAGFYFTLFGSDARVLTMGRSDAFFMDDISIFRNPANVSIYPNMLMGSMGIYVQDPELDDTTEFSALRSRNRDPQKPFFGGILSYSLNQSADAGDQYPMLSLGLVFNRYDEMLDYITPKSNNFFGIDKNLTTVDYVDPVGKLDFILGVALKNGAMIGGGAYVAFQKLKIDEDVDKESRVVRGNLGINWPVGKTMDLEVSFNGGLLTKVGKAYEIDENNDTNSTKSFIKIADNDVFVGGDIRLFSALSSLNGDFVPHVGFKLIKFNSTLEEQIFSFNAGFAVNINIDRGFFWAGVEGFYEENSSQRIDTLYQSVDRMGGRVSFGIERNIIWDWFVWRVGATKMLGFQKVGTGASATTEWYENAEADASDEDHIAFGLGLNIENRLKVDAVMAEDIFYTFTNLITGNHHHLTTRITATYSF